MFASLLCMIRGCSHMPLGVMKINKHHLSTEFDDDQFVALL